MSAEASGRMISSSVDHGTDEANIETDVFSMEIRGKRLRRKGGKGVSVVRQLVVWYAVAYEVCVAE